MGRVGLLAAVLGVALFAPATARAALAFAPCGQPDGIVCATLTVPLDRSGAVPGSVRLFVEKKPTAATPSQGALFVLGGGPGVTTTIATAHFARELAPALQTRDLYVADYRGVGLSDPLTCATPQDDAACSLQLGPRRFHYTTRDMVEDLEALRQAIGLSKIAIVGISYGTKIAQAYARRYGDRVELLVLDGVIPTDGWDPWMRSTYQAIPRVLRSLCAGGQCRGITSDPARDLERLIARARNNRLPVRFADSSGRVRSDDMHLGWLFRIYQGDAFFTAAHRARVPAAVAAYLRGDPFPLGRLYQQIARPSTVTGPHGPAEPSHVAWAATMCEDLPLPWRGETVVDRKVDRVVAQANAFPPGTFGPFHAGAAAVSPLIVECLRWASGPTHPVIAPRIRYTGRALILSGEHDLRTPFEDARAALAELPQASLVLVPAAGHGTRGTRCGSRAFAEFVAGREPPPCAPARSPTRPAPIPPVSLAKVAGWPGVPGKRGRTIRAVVETVRDVGYTLWADGPQIGLRGGSFSGTAGERASLRRVVYVPGVVVSGTFDDSAHTARVTVTGSGSRGTLTISARSVTGRLDGRPVRARGGDLVIRGPDNR